MKVVWRNSFIIFKIWNMKATVALYSCYSSKWSSIARNKCIPMSFTLIKLFWGGGEIESAYFGKQGAFWRLYYFCILCIVLSWLGINDNLSVYVALSKGSYSYLASWIHENDFSDFFSCLFKILCKFIEVYSIVQAANLSP